MALESSSISTPQKQQNGVHTSTPSTCCVSECSPNILLVGDATVDFSPISEHCESVSLMQPQGGESQQDQRLSKNLFVSGSHRSQAKPLIALRTPREKIRKLAESPPPAPRLWRPKLHLALEDNELTQVVEILSKFPELACMPLGDGTFELPLQRAIDCKCDHMIIEVLMDRGADHAGMESPELQPSSLDFAAWPEASGADPGFFDEVDFDRLWHSL